MSKVIVLASSMRVLFVRATYQYVFVHLSTCVLFIIATCAWLSFYYVWVWRH